MSAPTPPERAAPPQPPAARRAPGRLFPPAAFLGWANLTTSAVAAAGFLGLLLAPGHPRVAITLLCAATALDRVDGFLARRLGEESPFGAQLDSLADALAFCALPAALAHVLGARGPLGDAIPALFVLAGLWRLAYFNLYGLEEGRPGGVYTGVPTTIAASWLLIAAPLLVHLPAHWHGAALIVLTAALALLMVSRLPYPKNGPATNILYLLVPAATAAAWLWWP